MQQHQFHLQQEQEVTVQNCVSIEHMVMKTSGNNTPLIHLHSKDSQGNTWHLSNSQVRDYHEIRENHYMTVS